MDLLVFVAGSLVSQSSTDPIGGDIGNHVNFQGALYTVNDFDMDNNTTIWGPVLTRSATINNSALDPQAAVPDPVDVRTPGRDAVGDDGAGRPGQLRGLARVNVAAAAFVLAPALALGSFLNVVVARVPARRSILRPPSSCGSCETEILWRDNIPVLSYAPPPRALSALRRVDLARSTPRSRSLTAILIVVVRRRVRPDR